MQAVQAWLETWWAQSGWIVLRIGCAIAIGTVVGFERELRDKPAGLRTMILISLGACVFALVSQHVGGNSDPTRIAAQVVTGVGFLGAGAILRNQRAVFGLTTAASIWGISAVGIACGFGKFEIALIAGVAILIVLGVFQYVTGFIDRSRNVQRYRLATRDPAVRFRTIEPLFREANLRILSKTCYQDGDQFVFILRAIGHVNRHTQLREELLHASGVTLRRS